MPNPLWNRRAESSALRLRTAATRGSQRRLADMLESSGRINESPRQVLGSTIRVALVVPAVVALVCSVVLRYAGRHWGDPWPGLLWFAFIVGAAFELCLVPIALVRLACYPSNRTLGNWLCFALGAAVLVLFLYVYSYFIAQFRSP